MYKQVQKRSSESSATSTQKSNQYGPSSFSVQRQSNKKSNPLPARREYSTAARDALAAKIMRTLAADGIREEAAPNQMAELAMNNDVPATTEAEAIQQQDSSSGKVMLPIQAKLTIGAPGDKYEQEADRVAEQVMRMPDPEPLNDEALTVERQATRSLNPMSISRQKRLGAFEVQPIPEGLQRKCAACQEDEAVQRMPSVQLSVDGSLQASSDIESQLSRSQGGGSPLSDEVRSFMEPRIGADFSDVRVHTGSPAVQMNQELGAQAFTHGSDIYYGDGKIPGNNDLTAHELTHVVQQIGMGQTKPAVNNRLIQRQEVCDDEGVCWSQPDSEPTSSEPNFTPTPPEEQISTPMQSGTVASNPVTLPEIVIVGEASNTAEAVLDGTGGAGGAPAVAPNDGRDGAEGASGADLDSELDNTDENSSSFWKDLGWFASGAGTHLAVGEVPGDS